MRKKIICIILCMLLCVTATAITGTQINDENNEPQIQSNHTLQSKDMWDVQFNYDVGGLSDSLYLAGAIFDGEYFYAPEWNSEIIYKFDIDGSYIESFSIPGVSGIRDMAFDGEYIYGGDGSGSFLWQMDFTAQTLVNTLAFPVAARSCAYDADNDAFWVNVWSSDLMLIDREGTILNTIPGPESLYGSAWDGISQVSGFDGPFLWVLTGTSTGMDATIKQYDIASKSLTGVEHNVAQDLGAGIAGGLFFTTLYEPGFATLGGIVQGSDPIEDYLFGYEVGTTNEPPQTPDAPSGPTDGLTNVEYSFTAQTTDPEGEDIYYWFNWGDGTNSGWLGPYSSGAMVTATNIWTEAGEFDITVKAKDDNGHQSGSSDPLTITIIQGPFLEIENIAGGLFKISATLKNTGSEAANNIDWSIALEGGFIIMGKQTTGQILVLESDDERTITSDPIIGFGKTMVTITATVPQNTAGEEQEAMVLLFFIRI
jgi:hypothetical protein